MSYGRHSIVRFETCPIRLGISALLFLVASQRIRGTLVRDHFRVKEARNSFSFFQKNKTILSLGTVLRVIFPTEIWPGY